MRFELDQLLLYKQLLSKLTSMSASFWDINAMQNRQRKDNPNQLGLTFKSLEYDPQDCDEKKVNRCFVAYEHSDSNCYMDTSDTKYGFEKPSYEDDTEWQEKLSERIKSQHKQSLVAQRQMLNIPQPKKKTKQNTSS